MLPTLMLYLLLPFTTLMLLFAASHILLANPPLRDRLVSVLGEGGFRILYSLLSLALLGGAIWSYRQIGPMAPLWVPADWLWPVSSGLMLFACVLFAGSFTPANKALAGVPVDRRPPSGVLFITRHPMMWAFAIWALVHGMLSAAPHTLVLAAGIGFVALVGAAAQDRKKQAQLGDRWRTYEKQTGWWPFAAQISGRQPWRTLWPGWLPLLIGLLLWLALTYVHPMLMQAPVVPPWATLA